MNFLRRLFGSKGDEGGQEPPSMPWDRRPSILEFVRSHVPTDGPGVDEGGYTLPDDERVNAWSRLRWGMGSLDGVMTHHMGTGENEEAVRRTVELTLAYSRQPTATNKAAVYQHVIAAHVVSIIDPVIEALLNEGKSLGAEVKDFRLGLEISVIQSFAGRIVKLLKERDPLSERVHLSPLELLAKSISGMASETARRATGRRPVSKTAAGA